MEHASIHKLLVSIPSQASNFAMACVGQILEEQIQDPRKMAKNLKKIGSVVWSSAFTGEINAAGDTGSLFGRCKLKLSLKNLPQKIRHQIWSYLSNKDIMNLRLVCSKTRFDVDHGIGLPVIMDTASESMQWLQKVTTRSCFVTRMENFLYFNFLPQPDRMKYLHFDQKIYVPPEMLDLVLRKFSNLKNVIFYTEDFYQPVDGRVLKPVSPSITTELIEILMQKETLVGVKVKFNEKTSRTEWKLELRPGVCKTSLERTNVGQVHLDIPSEKLHQQNDCLRLLEFQHKLFEFRSDLPGIKWNSYFKSISENSKTLTGLHLLNMKSSKEPFDCIMLKDCINLRFLSLSGEAAEVRTSAAFAYFPVVGINWLSLGKLCTLTLENVYIVPEDLLYLKDELKKTVWIHMKKCLGGSEILRDLKLGNSTNISPVEDDCDTNMDFDMSDLEFDQDMSHYYYGYDDRARKSCAQSVVSHIINEIPVSVVKGMILTAWIVFC